MCFCALAVDAKPKASEISLSVGATPQLVELLLDEVEHIALPFGEVGHDVALLDPTIGDNKA